MTVFLKNKFRTQWPHLIYWLNLTLSRSSSNVKVVKLNLQQISAVPNWLTKLTFYVPPDAKQVISETFPKTISSLDTEKLNLTQQKHTFTNQKNVQHKKATAGFSHLLRHSAWKWRGSILVSAIHKLVTYKPTYIQPRDPHADNTQTYKALDQWQISDFITRLYLTTKLQYATVHVATATHRINKHGFGTNFPLQAHKLQILPLFCSLFRVLKIGLMLLICNTAY